MDKIIRKAEMVSKINMQWADTVSKHAVEKVYSRVDLSVVFPGALSKAAQDGEQGSQTNLDGPNKLLYSRWS